MISARIKSHATSLSFMSTYMQKFGCWPFFKSTSYCVLLFYERIIEQFHHNIFTNCTILTYTYCFIFLLPRSISFLLFFFFPTSPWLNTSSLLCLCWWMCCHDGTKAVYLYGWDLLFGSINVFCYQYRGVNHFLEISGNPYKKSEIYLT